MKILIVDIDPYTQKVLQSILSREGYTVFFSSAGRAGLLSAKQFVPDLILLNIPLEDSDGMQFLQKLGADSETEGVTVIILIDESQAYAKIKYLDAGASACLEKPFRPWQLLAQIESLHL